MRKIREKINLFVAQSPRRAVLVGIMLFNLAFIVIAAGAISIMSNHMEGLKQCNFLEAIYYTITIILDAGCIDNVITDIRTAGAGAAIVCIGVAVVGMVVFVGALIGYMTNGISSFIESKNNGENKLYLSDHIVMINWNPRGSEIMNEFLYANRATNIVVLVAENRDEVDEEISNRIDAILTKGRQEAYETAEKLPYIEKKKYLRNHLLENKITYVVREGDVSTSSVLDDISISKAKTVIILDNGSDAEKENGNVQTIKTLIQVAEISKANANQTILVEVNDDRTEDLVNRIIEFQERDDEERIISLPYNRLLAKAKAQIAIFPEFNDMYNLVFSNRGHHFISQDVPEQFTRENENAYIEEKLAQTSSAIPLTIMNTTKGNKAFFLVDARSDLEETSENREDVPHIRLKPESERIERTRNIVVMGHNSYMDSVMKWFDDYRRRMRNDDGSEVLNIVAIDEASSLAKNDYYRQYPYVATFDADIYEGKIIDDKIHALFGADAESTTIMILSDDMAAKEDVDANVFMYLVYLRQYLFRKEKDDPDFRRDAYTIIAEIVDPKNAEIAKNYGADKVMVGSRYMSRITSQISMEEPLREFYADILDMHPETEKYDDRKIQIVNAKDFFEEIPGKCTASKLIRMVFASGEEGHKSLILGYVRKNGFTMFRGDQRKIEVELRPDDKIILFSKGRFGYDN